MDSDAVAATAEGFAMGCGVCAVLKLLWSLA